MADNRDHYIPLRYFSIVLGSTTPSSCPFYQSGDHCSPIDTTIHLFVSVLLSWGPLFTSFYILWTTVLSFRAFQLSWGPLNTSLWVFYQPGHHYPPLRDCSIILESHTHLLVTVLSLLGPLPTSQSVFCHPGDSYLLFRDCFIIPGSTARPLLLDRSTILGTTIHLYVSVLSFGVSLPTPSNVFYHAGVHYSPLCFINEGSSVRSRLL